MTFNEAAMERMLDYLRKSGDWNIAEAFRDATEMAAILAAQQGRGRSLSADERAFVALMQTLPNTVGDHFGQK